MKMYCLERLGLIVWLLLPNREVTFKHTRREITLHVNEKGHTIPLVSHDSFDKAMKSSISAYLIFVKDALNSTDVSPNGSLKLDSDLHSFLNEHAELFIDDIPDELPPIRGVDDHRIDLIPGSSPPNKPPYRVSLAQQEEIISLNDLVQKDPDAIPQDQEREWDRSSPVYSKMVKELAGSVTTKQAGEDVQEHTYSRRPLPRARNTTNTGFGEGSSVPPGKLNLAQIRQVLLSYQGLVKGEKPMSAEALAKKYNVDVVLLERVLRLHTIQDKKVDGQTK
ncbi:hypothetical protein L7F22_021149 [Adiantum nelumboides]|nr:hypothetical protein [Adiantum nelumboides]